MCRTKNAKFQLDLDNQADVDRLLTCIANGNALTDPAPLENRPKFYDPVFKHPLPISAHSSVHDANLKVHAVIANIWNVYTLTLHKDLFCTFQIFIPDT